MFSLLKARQASNIDVNIVAHCTLLPRFLGRCAWDTGYQPATMIEEGERLGRVLGDRDILFMCHHGTLVSQCQIQRVSLSILYFVSGCGSQDRD